MFQSRDVESRQCSVLRADTENIRFNADYKLTKETPKEESQGWATRLLYFRFKNVSFMFTHKEQNPNFNVDHDGTRNHGPALNSLVILVFVWL